MILIILNIIRLITELLLFIGVSILIGRYKLLFKILLGLNSSSNLILCIFIFRLFKDLKNLNGVSLIRTSPLNIFFYFFKSSTIPLYTSEY